MSDVGLFNARTRDVVAMLADVLGARVALCDLEDVRLHEWRGEVTEGRGLEWRTSRGDASLLERRGHCHAVAAVSRRWVLIVSKAGFLHPGANELTAWAAKALRDDLAAGASLSFTPPRGGGAPSGGAELAIPLWWMRRS
jgi:hypothetical protein